MAMLSFCGIDVSKDRLDVMVLPGQQSFAVRNGAAAQEAEGVGPLILFCKVLGATIIAIG